MLYTDDIKASIDFYTKYLGFSCKAHVEEWDWASLEKDEVEIMLSRPGNFSSYHGPKFSGSLYMNTDSVDELWEKLKDDVNIVYPIETMDYGMREFAISDNNGYVIMLGQELDNRK